MFSAKRNEDGVLAGPRQNLKCLRDMKEDNKALDIALSAKNRKDAMKAQHQDRNSRTEGRTKGAS